VKTTVNKGIPYMTGAQLQSTLTSVGVELDVNAEWSGCWLCGEAFQSPLDRAYYRLLIVEKVEEFKLVQVKTRADMLRDQWRTMHSESHSGDQHEELAASNDLCTLEAAVKLAPLGTFPIQGSSEMMTVLREAPRTPEGRINV
jgi:hypothetical protein